MAVDEKVKRQVGQICGGNLFFCLRNEILDGLVEDQDLKRVGTSGKVFQRLLEGHAGIILWNVPQAEDLNGFAVLFE